jgi:hypothetical protein
MMAQLSESTPRSPYYFPPMWNIFGEVDRTNFQWEPPSTKSSKPEAGTGWLQDLQDWLRSRWLPTTPALSPSMSEAAEIVPTAPLSVNQAWAHEDISTFRSQLRNALKSGDDDAIFELCNNLNKRLKQSLTVGEIPDSMLITALEIHRYDLQDIPLRESLALTFCQEIWDGMTTCKVVPVSMIDGAVMDGLIGLLSVLPISLEVQTLAHSILCSTSSTQLRMMRQSVKSLLYAWVHTWTVDECPSAADMSGSSVQAEEAVGLVEHTLGRALGLVPSLEQNGKREDWIEMQRFVHEARNGIHRSIKTVDLAENILWPQRASVATLADALQNLETHSSLLSSIIIKACSQYVSNVIDKAPKESRAVLRFHWLSLVAQMRNINDGLFVQIFHALNDTERLIRPNAISTIILDRWITQGTVKDPLIVRNAFRARGHASGAIADLLYILERHNEAWWTKTEEVFSLLQKIGAYQRVHSILTEMLLRRLKLPTALILRVLNNMSYYNANLAYNIFHIWLPIRADRRGLHMEKCPDFLLSLIKSRVFSSKAIWDVLRIPLYHKVRYGFPGFSNDPSHRLWPTSESLITKMAVEFAAQSDRRPRFALRNVSQCLLHLRIRGNPITPKLTKSLTLSGVTMDMVKDRWISEGRLAWSLKMVEQAEGTPVAEALDKQVFLYRQQLVERKRLGQLNLPQWVRDEKINSYRQQLVKERERIRQQLEIAQQATEGQEGQWIPRKLQQERRKQEREELEQKRLERERLKQETRERQKLEREWLEEKRKGREKREWEKLEQEIEERAKNKRELLESTMNELEHAEKKSVRGELQEVKSKVQWGRIPERLAFEAHTETTDETDGSKELQSVRTNPQLEDDLDERPKKKWAKKEPQKTKKQPAWGRLPPEDDPEDDLNSQPKKKKAKKKPGNSGMKKQPAWGRLPPEDYSDE